MNVPLFKIVTGRFEEVLRLPDRYFNDHCLFHHNDVWHFFGILGPVGRSCYDEGSEVSFAHATSRNLHEWTMHPDVMTVTNAGPDSHHVFAPHVLEKDGLFHMFYTGVDGKRRQRICLATSNDLFSWKRSEANPIIVPSLSWAKWPGEDNEPDSAVGNCRDAHVMRLPGGRFAAYWVAELNSRCGPGDSCVAASISDDLIHWQEVGPIFTMRRWERPPTLSVESPCVVFKDGDYWLFFKHGWATHYVCGAGPFDFRNRQAVPLGFSHASEVFQWDGRWYITHCSGAPDDFEYKKTNRTRGLFLGELDWPEKGYPRFKHESSPAAIV